MLLKTQYKFIHFIEADAKSKTRVFSCQNNRSKNELGVVRWYAPWRQYCYFPTVQAVYSDGCLNDISRFIGQLKEER